MKGWVYFDDFKITHTGSPVVAGADYYPFGLTMTDREILDEAYRYGYQGQYSEEDKTTGWNEFELRMYDARFGRWTSIDPYGQFASPYVGMGNGPHMSIDPDGGFSIQHAFIGAGIGSLAGVGVGYLAGARGNDLGKWALGGAAVGFFGGGFASELVGAFKGKEIAVRESTAPKSSVSFKPPRLKRPQIGSGGALPAKLPREVTPYILQSYLTYTGNSERPNVGTLTWTDLWSDGSRQVSGTWDANSGSRSLLPTSEADDWILSNFRNRTDPAMVRNGVGFSVNISPDPRFGRTVLRIHPDGGVPGTAGCIGLTGNAAQLRDFANRIQGHLAGHDTMRLRVRGTYNPNNLGGSINPQLR